MYQSWWETKPRFWFWRNARKKSVSNKAIIVEADDSFFDPVEPITNFDGRRVTDYCKSFVVVFQTPSLDVKPKAMWAYHVGDTPLPNQRPFAASVMYEGDDFFGFVAERSGREKRSPFKDPSLRDLLLRDGFSLNTPVSCVFYNSGAKPSHIMTLSSPFDQGVSGRGKPRHEILR